MVHVGREIRRVREERGLNQTQLAASVGTGPAAISRIENGRQSPNIETLEKIAQALEMEMSDLFPKVSAPLQLEFDEQRGGADSALAEKLQQQLDTQLKVLRERQSKARSDEDLHEAAKDFQHWWLFSFDWLSTFLRMHPEDLGPRLEEVVNRAGHAVNEEFPQGAINPRDVPDMSEVLRGWAAHQEADV